MTIPYGRTMLKTFIITRVSSKMLTDIRGWQSGSMKLIVSVEEMVTGSFTLPVHQNILTIF